MIIILGLFRVIRRKEKKTAKKKKTSLAIQHSFVLCDIHSFIQQWILAYLPMNGVNSGGNGNTLLQKDTENSIKK